MYIFLHAELDLEVKSMWEKRTKAGTTHYFDFQDSKETCYSAVYNTREENAPQVAKLLMNVLVNPNYLREQAEKAEEVRAIYSLNHKDCLDIESGALANKEMTRNGRPRREWENSPRRRVQRVKNEVTANRAVDKTANRLKA
jgi:hypothetical protein